MPLDPQVEAFLNAVNSRKSGDPILSLPPAEARKAMSTMFASVFDKKDAVPVNEVLDFSIPGRAGSVGVRLYRPGGKGPYPALVFFHGGGWVLGSLNLSDHVCRTLCSEAGCIVVSADYRLAPEFPFPAGLEDCYDTVQWFYEHASDYGIDKERIAVGGESAGGNLAAAVCILSRDHAGPPIVYQLLVTPATDLAYDTESYRSYGEGYFLTRSTMEICRQYYIRGVEDIENPLVSPLRVADPSGLPPGLTVTAEYDPLRDDGEAYARKLTSAGVAMELCRYPGAIHGFSTMPQLSIGNQSLREMAASLRRAFGI